MDLLPGLLLKRGQTSVSGGAMSSFVSQQTLWEQLIRGAAGALPCSSHLTLGEQPGQAVVPVRGTAVGGMAPRQVHCHL